MNKKTQLGMVASTEQRESFDAELERLEREIGQPHEMTDDEILEAAARITAARGVDAESMRIAELECDRQETERKIKEAQERKEALLREYAESNLRSGGLVDYVVHDNQLIAFKRVGGERFAFEVCGFMKEGSIAGLHEILFDRESAEIIVKSMRFALEL